MTLTKGVGAPKKKKNAAAAAAKQSQWHTGSWKLLLPPCVAVVPGYIVIPLSVTGIFLVFQVLKKEVILPLLLALVKPPLEYGIQVWELHFNKNVVELERVQKRVHPYD